jgi:quercetin dioxygenase-like cupin family protein
MQQLAAWLGRGALSPVLLQPGILEDWAYESSHAALEETMGQHIKTTTMVRAAGTPPKNIEEFIGRVNSGTDDVSVAIMRSPAGWSEPGQTPDFDEYTLVLSGGLHVETRGGVYDIAAGEAFISPRGEWVRYSTPAGGGAEYVSVCRPAFGPKLVHRDE